MKEKTKFFQNCLGVFQGGGCKGAAYVGAFQECLERGVSFSEVVGASAGSIIAAFIAAGATPKQLEVIIRDLDFNKFKRRSKKIDDVSTKGYLRLAHVFPKKDYRDAITKLGMYDSSYIEDFVEEKLQEILKLHRNVTFNDLIIPCSIIVSDLETNQAKVYSKEFTPDVEVSKAVRKSSNIPIFFQPINKRYVDGGMLSNLPVYLFKQKNSLHSKILAFTLTPDEEKVKISNFVEYGKALINTTLYGGLDIQLKLAENIHFIDIQTGSIQATDFDKIDSQKIDFLIEKGKKGAENFFENELSIVKSNNHSRDINIDSFETNNIIVSSSNYLPNEIIISTANLKFIYELFPTFLNWITHKCSIKILLKVSTDSNTSETQKYQLRLLESLGVEVITTDAIPFDGFIFDAKNSQKCQALIYKKSDDSHINYSSKYYHGIVDSDVINLMHNELIKAFSTTENDKITIGCKKIIDEDIFKRLRTIRQYEDPHVRLKYEKIVLEDITFLTKYVVGYKYRQIQNIINLYQSNEIELFQPISIILKGNKESIVSPPIVEKIGEKYYLIEGNTRVTYLYKNGYKDAYFIVIENVNEELPSSGRFKANEILITDKKKIGDERYDDFNHDKYRGIEAAIREPKTSLI